MSLRDISNISSNSRIMSWKIHGLRREVCVCVCGLRSVLRILGEKKTHPRSKQGVIYFIYFHSLKSFSFNYSFWDINLGILFISQIYSNSTPSILCSCEHWEQYYHPWKCKVHKGLKQPSLGLLEQQHSWLKSKYSGIEPVRPLMYDL